MAKSNALNAGFQYMADYARLIAEAHDEDNDEKMKGLVEIGSAWHKELTGIPFNKMKDLTAQKVVLIAVWLTMLGGDDPFKGSRGLMQAYKKKWGVK